MRHDLPKRMQVRPPKMAWYETDIFNDAAKFAVLLMFAGWVLFMVAR